MATIRAKVGAAIAAPPIFSWPAAVETVVPSKPLGSV
jgi:hypothetical protein